MLTIFLTVQMTYLDSPTTKAMCVNTWFFV